MKKKTLYVMFLSTVVLVLFSARSFADDVYTKEGRRFIGSIIEETETSVTLRSEEGTVIINQSDIMHIERSSEPESAATGFSVKNIIQDIKSTYRKLSHNNWHFVRRKIKVFHGRVFVALNKNKVYQLITNIEAVERFRQDNYKSFIFAVYMVLLLLVGMVFSFIQRLIYGVYCRFRGMKPRYDT